ncbi:hypothetical protein [Pseudonocardia spinosispora]|uniref:hypothetical protein n=1 Tax=Pseudonocardia spinosispora TaxID=103441 RepID=UPI000415A36E|nr:hypothetical protein [Pseudonocardia spinosispora]
MSVRRFLFGSAAAAMAAGLLLAGPATATADSVTLASVSTPVHPSAPASDVVPLQEFQTPGSAGYFYTLNPGEAATAVSKHKFTKQASVGKLHPSAVPGGVAIHRLRSKAAAPSYMLSISPGEISSGNFVDEGVLGYADGTQKPGQVQLMRFSNHGKWRALSNVPANITNMKAAGWTVDGPLGWYQP